MQLNLFGEEDFTRKLKEGEETFYCRACKSYLPEEFFNNFALKQFRKKKGENQTQGAGGAVWCKPCRANYQKGKREAENKAPSKPINPIPCNCCGTVTNPEDLHLDHDHNTYDFRGWLCRRCNGGIGQLGDNIEGLEKAMKYLLTGKGHT